VIVAQYIAEKGGSSVDRESGTSAEGSGFWAGSIFLIVPDGSSLNRRRYGEAIRSVTAKGAHVRDGDTSATTCAAPLPIPSLQDTRE
jgi:hypothetical protein